LLISVLLAVYNGETYLKEAIDSILCQTVADFEFIIVDDGSTDNTAAILQSYTDSRLRVIRAEKNCGLIDSLNKGVVAAKGKYLARLDADDVAMPDRFEKQLQYFAQHPDTVLLGTGAMLIDSASKELYWTYYQQNIPAIPTHLLFRNVFIHSSVMVKTEILREFPFDKAYYLAEDYIVWVQMAQKYAVAAIKEPLVKHRIHETNITKVKAARHFETVQKIFAYQLAALGIAATENDLVLHKKLGQYKFEKGEDFVQQTSAWLWQLVEKNRAKKIYHRQEFEKWILQLWVDVCLHNLATSKKIAFIFTHAKITTLLPLLRKCTVFAKLFLAKVEKS
jgi:glycosyltransferase involved in cell wall biosynthesis